MLGSGSSEGGDVKRSTSENSQLIGSFLVRAEFFPCRKSPNQAVYSLALSLLYLLKALDFWRLSL